MFSLNNQQQQPNSRHFPANQSLNKNADGFVCSINMTHKDIGTTRIESKPPKSNNTWGATQQPQQQQGGYFGQTNTTQPTGGGGLFGSSNPQGGGIFGASQPQQTQQPSGGGLFGPSGGGLFSQQQQQPATGTGGLFGAQTTQQPQTGGGLFGTSMFGQQQQPQQQGGGGGLFGTSTNTGGGLFGATQNTNNPAGGGGGLFGSSSTPAPSGGGLFSSQPQQQQQQGGLFGQTQQTTGGLFGSQPQQQQQGGLFGGLNNQNQQRPLISTQQMNQPFQPNTQQLQQYQQSGQPQYIIVQQPNQDYQLNVNLDFDFNDELEQQHLREIEDNFRSGLPSFTDRRTSFQDQQTKKININIKNKEKPTRLLGRSSFLSKPQSNITSTQSKPMSTQSSQLLSQPSIIKKSSIIQPTEFFVASTLNSKDQQLTTSLHKLGLRSDNKVRQLKKILLDQFFSTEDQKKLKSKQILMIENTNRISKVRQDDEDLSFIKRDTNITLIEGNVQKEDEMEEIQEIQEEENHKFNPNCPRINEKELIQCVPPIEDLEYYSDEQLSEVNNFQIISDYGSVQFLYPVDLRKLDLDKVVIFNQDSVDFYPESEGYELPQEGEGLNVKCMITFENFGNGSRKMRELRNDDYENYCEKVQKWSESLDMKLLSVEKNGKVIVQLDKL